MDPRTYTRWPLGHSFAVALLMSWMVAMVLPSLAFASPQSTNDDDESEATDWQRPPGLSTTRALQGRSADSPFRDAPAGAGAYEPYDEGYYLYDTGFKPATVALGVRMFPVSFEVWNDDGPSRWSFTTTTIGLDLGMAVAPGRAMRFTFLVGAEFTVTGFDADEPLEVQPVSTIIPGTRLMIGLDVEVHSFSLGVRYGIREFWLDDDDPGQLILVGNQRQHTILQLLGAAVIDDRLRLGVGMEFPMNTDIFEYIVLIEFGLRFQIG